MTDNSDEEMNTFVQNDNGQMLIDLEDFEYMKNNYDNSILESHSKGNSNYESIYNNNTATNNNDSNDNTQLKGIEEINTIEFYDNKNELKLIEINKNNEINSQRNITEVKYQSDKNNSRMNEQNDNNENQIYISEKEMNNYKDDSIFCSERIVDNNIRKRENNFENDIYNKNADPSDLNNNKLKVLKRIEKKGFDMCKNFKEGYKIGKITVN
ncbi:hypothetical protein PIROE2DRAFT_64128 [Piromyces sp. E2]|nr:hypothetical protein PIROE2DRAFT_64128 [Piromyces sp. E2]|eukprot:OUM58894.1 hypothetical protein PIROE2DRAFT_64128 [Piromyces sp. E2]